MITVLVLLYALLLAFLIHKKKLPNNILVWFTIILWVIFLEFLLFFPMKIGAPSGQARVLTYSVNIIPNIAGRVEEIVAQPNQPLKKGDVLFKVGDENYRHVLEAAEAQLAEAKQNVLRLNASLDIASAAVKRAAAVRDRSKQAYERMAKANKNKTKPFSEQQVESARLGYEADEAALDQATASENAAKLAATSEINGVNTTVARLEAMVEKAKHDLNETTVLAPTDGYVTTVALRVGQRLSPASPAMNFVEASDNFVSIQIEQIYKRHIKVGHKVEMSFKTQPGKTYTGIVDGITQTTSTGEALASGVVATAQQLKALPYFIRVKLDEGQGAEDLPAGSVGEGAIYTDALTFTHPIQRVTVRMGGLMNFLIP